MLYWRRYAHPAAGSDQQPEKGVCSGYEITLKGPKNNFFINEQEVEQILMKANNGKIKGVPAASFDLNEMERMLRKNSWINAAELYFDNKNLLHVTITEKEPVARIFTADGSSFYIDNTGKTLPLSDELSAKVPVFTGFPGGRVTGAADSTLLNEIKNTALYISNDPFWMAQVAQIDITPERKFEMIPVVGNHLVRLGDGENMAAKFHRLMLFYKQVLSKTGMDHYKLIDVQYKGQVVASRYAGDPKVDSVQLRKNVEQLLRQSMEAATDTVVKPLPQVIQLEKDSADDTNTASLPENEVVNPEQPRNPNPRLDEKIPAVRQQADGGQAARPAGGKASRGKEEKQKEKGKKPATGRNDKPEKPKAVMPKKPVEDENGGYN
ncbi:MAG: cell division protein FtsQ/DivIB [Chitinophagaceae bacterium]